MTAPAEKSPEERLREKLEPYPAEVQALVWDYRKAPAPELLERITLGMLDYHGGEPFRAKFAEKGDQVLLVEDVGFDSLALVEISFHAEEFTGLIIMPQDFMQVKTVRDLQAFLRARAFPAAAGAS